MSLPTARTRNRQVRRVLRVVALLQSCSHWTAKDLGRTLQVSARTIRRDLAAIRYEGVKT